MKTTKNAGMRMSRMVGRSHRQSLWRPAKSRTNPYASSGKGCLRQTNNSRIAIPPRGTANPVTTVSCARTRARRKAGDGVDRLAQQGPLSWLNQERGGIETMRYLLRPVAAFWAATMIVLVMPVLAFSQTATGSFGAAYWQPLQTSGLSSNLGTLVFSPDGRFLYQGANAWDIDPVMGLPAANRPDLFAGMTPPEVEDGRIGNRILFALAPERADIAFVIYSFIPTGASTVSKYLFCIVERDVPTGAMKPAQVVAEYPAEGVTNIASSTVFAIARDSNALAFLASVKVQENTFNRVGVLEKGADGQWTVKIEVPPTIGGESTGAQAMDFLAGNRVILLWKSTRDIVTYLNDPVGVPDWAQYMPILWQGISPIAAPRLYVDGTADDLVLAPDISTGIVQIHKWASGQHSLAHWGTWFNPLFASSIAPAHTRDGNLFVTAHTNRLRLWRWNRGTLTLDQLHEQSFHHGRYVFEQIVMAPNGRRLYGLGRTQGTIGHSVLVSIEIDRGPAKSDAVRALLTGEEIPPAFDANQDDVFDAADVLKLVP
ncbi:MAG: hypothetical protein KF858_04600 [Candidatus Sumerlaeia bacterium]|nr:hypothetical protein [Candidatus Sumerlaeia bacterium]